MSEANRVDSESRVCEVPIHQVLAAETSARADCVVVEEPMEIRVVFGPPEKRVMRSVSITMRTPGHDDELAAGFLFTEGILNSPQQIGQIETRGVDPDGKSTGNIVRVSLRDSENVDLSRLQRHFFTTSSCGVCGKASLDALEVQGLRPLGADWTISGKRITALPGLLRASQPTFSQTGGLHAAGICGLDGVLLAVREDVGRHNAVDKLLGRFFLDGQTPLSRCVMIISGRASFEIMQKALVAGVPAVVAVGAPSSLAVDLADRYGMTLVGFASENRFNIYARAHRIDTAS